MFNICKCIKSQAAHFHEMKVSIFLISIFFLPQSKDEIYASKLRTLNPEIGIYFSTNASILFFQDLDSRDITPHDYPHLQNVALYFKSTPKLLVRCAIFLIHPHINPISRGTYSSHLPRGKRFSKSIYSLRAYLISRTSLRAIQDVFKTCAVI